MKSMSSLTNCNNKFFCHSSPVAQTGFNMLAMFVFQQQKWWVWGEYTTSLRVCYIFINYDFMHSWIEDSSFFKLMGYLCFRGDDDDDAELSLAIYQSLQVGIILTM